MSLKIMTKPCFLQIEQGYEVDIGKPTLQC